MYHLNDFQWDKYIQTVVQYFDMATKRGMVMVLLAVTRPSPHLLPQRLNVPILRYGAALGFPRLPLPHLLTEQGLDWPRGAIWAARTQDTGLMGPTLWEGH